MVCCVDVPFDPFLTATGWLFFGECSSPLAPRAGGDGPSDALAGVTSEGGGMGEVGEHGVIEEGKVVEREGVTCEGVAEGSKGGEGRTQ